MDKNQKNIDYIIFLLLDPNQAQISNYVLKKNAYRRSLVK